jgi:bile acid-coenzyme A ligase
MARQSFAQVISAHAATRPDRVVVVSDHEGLALTARELDTRSNRLAREYLACGVGRDDLVAVGMPSCAEFIIACAAIWKAGATPHPVPPSLPDAERAALERLARPALAVGARPVDPAIPWLPDGFRPDATRPDGPLPDTWARSWKAPTSSGSTGRPKIVAANAPALIDLDQPVAPFLPRHAIQLVNAPLWHSASFTYAFRGLLTGHRLVLTGGFDEHRFGALVAAHRVSWTLLAPSMIHRLVRIPPLQRRHWDMASLNCVLHMGAVCSPSDKRELIGWLGADKVVEVYAGSESNGLTMITGPEWLRRPGSVGKPIGGTEIRIMRADGSPAKAGEIGQVWMRRGDRPAYRYYGAPSRRTDDGWDTLGDLGSLDTHGYLTVVGRADDVMAAGGVTVYPSRVEHALEQHPAVRGAVVFASRDGLSAVVDIGDGESDAAQIRRRARAHLTPAELPVRIHLTRTPVRNEAGKVRRSTLATRHGDESPGEQL